MSPFWRYFQERLAWLPIFRPGPLSALAKGLALHFDSCRKDIIWLRDQWIVTRAEAEMVARYGESRGMPRFRFDTDESYRNRVHNAFVWHKLGGKVAGLERIYAENGFEATVSSSPDPELWAHFRVRINIATLVFGLEALEMSFWLANEFKPARSVLEGIWTFGEMPVNRFFAAAMRSLTKATPHLWFASRNPPHLSRSIGLAPVALTVSRQRFWFVPSPYAGMARRIAACASGRTATTLRLFFPARRTQLATRQALCAHGITLTKIFGRQHA